MKNEGRLHPHEADARNARLKKGTPSALIPVMPAATSMKAQRWIHALALFGIVIAAALSIWGCFRASYVPPLAARHRVHSRHRFLEIFAAKVRIEPEKWGLGVGIFLILMFAFQTYLWIGAIGNPRIVELGIDLGMTAYILHELPLIVGGICCVLLRWLSPNDDPRPA